MSEPSKEAPCPICGKALPSGKEAEKFAPFCSRRCANRDLGRWLKGGYVIPGAAEEKEMPKAEPEEEP